jgi:hypothetical protein
MGVPSPRLDLGVMGLTLTGLLRRFHRLRFQWFLPSIEGVTPAIDLVSPRSP